MGIFCEKLHKATGLLYADAAVNDADEGQDRHFLRFGNGITSGQIPELYATLLVSPAVAEDNR